MTGEIKEITNDVPCPIEGAGGYPGNSQRPRSVWVGTGGAAGYGGSRRRGKLNPRPGGHEPSPCRNGSLTRTSGLRQAPGGQSRQVSGAGKIIQGRRHAPPGEGNAGEGQTHLHPAQGPGEHQIVEVPQVPDPEDLALQLSQAGAEGHVEPL